MNIADCLDKITKSHFIHDIDVYYDYVLSQANYNGPWLEFGVYAGKTLSMLATYASANNQVVCGFDSFEGLPEDWDKGNGEILNKGWFGEYGYSNVKLHMDKYHPNVTLVRGWFQDSLPAFLSIPKNKRPYSLIHIDCDLYSSTKTILTELKPYIVPGTVLMFDEIIGYATYKDHEIKALVESDLKVDCLCHSYMQAAFVVV